MISITQIYVKILSKNSSTNNIICPQLCDVRSYLSKRKLASRNDNDKNRDKSIPIYNEILTSFCEFVKLNIEYFIRSLTTLKMNKEE